MTKGITVNKFFCQTVLNRVFNLIRFIDKKNIGLNPSRDYIKKSVTIEEWIVIDKIVELSLNFCLIKILKESI